MNRYALLALGLALGFALALALPIHAGISGGGGGAGITPTDYISGFRVTVTGAATVSVTAGAAMDRGDTVLLSSTSTITTSTAFGAWSDANNIGLDVGAEAVSTWYHLHVIRDADGDTGVLLSASKTAPSMPAGATLRRWIGAIRNDASSNLLQGEQIGIGAERRWMYRGQDNMAAPFDVLTNGASDTDAAIALSALVPPQALTVEVYYLENAASFSDLKHATETVNAALETNTVETATGELFLSAASEITYNVGGGTGRLWVRPRGYTLNLDGAD